MLGEWVMQACEFVKDNKVPDGELVGKLFEEMKKEESVLIGKGGLYGNVVRISPLLLYSKSEVDDFIKLWMFHLNE